MKEYINSGILEAYVLGCASDEEVKDVLYMKEQHPEVKDALFELETDMEKLAMSIAVPPPANLWPKIADELNEITLRQPRNPSIYREPEPTREQATENGQQYISVESESTHMRVHKAWRWIFAGVFLLGKIFLGFAIYYFIQNMRAQQQIETLKTEIRQLK